MDKKPELFVNKLNRSIENNERVYYSNIREEKVELEDKKEDLKTNVSEKINNIFKSSNYVYKAEVKIKLKDKDIVKKIIGKNQKYLITIDNELIPISEIIDISI